MKKILTLTTLTVALAMAASGPVLAHGAKPQHGGVVNSVGDLSFELVSKDGKAVIYVDDHGKQKATAGANATLTVLSGKKKAYSVLEASGINALVSKEDITLAPGTKAVASISFPDKPALSVRFAVR